MIELTGQPQLNFLGHFGHLLHIHEPQYLVYCETGGRGSGKTQQTAHSLLTVGSFFKKRMFACRREETRIELSSYQEIVDLIDHGFCAYGWKYNKQMAWNERTEATIKFIGVNDINVNNREALKGLAKAHIIWVDEAQCISMLTLNTLMPLLGRVPHSCIIFTFNRIAKKLPIWEKFGLPNPPKHVHFHESHYSQNNFLQPAFFIEADDVKNRFPDIYEVIYNNNPVGSNDNNVVKNWSDANIQEVEYNKKLPIYLSCDFNYNPNCWTLSHRDSRKSYFFDCFCKNMITEDLIQLVLEKYRHHGLIVINGDASGKKNTSNSDKSDYIIIKNALIRDKYHESYGENETGRRFRFEENRANGSRRARFNAFNNKVMERDGTRSVIVDPENCGELILACEELKLIPGTDRYDVPGGIKLKQDPMYATMEHIYDAASYHINRYHPVTEMFEPFKRAAKNIKDQFFGR
jgi:PBSX family phage terminase large subunit